MPSICNEPRVSSAVPAVFDAAVDDTCSSPSLTAKGNETGGSHARTSLATKVDRNVRASSGATVGGKRPSVVIANASGDANVAKKMQSFKLRPFPVSNPISIMLDEEIEMEIDHNSSIFSKHALICRFKGVWPSLPELHDWILQHWEPLLADLSLVGVAVEVGLLRIALPAIPSMALGNTSGIAAVCSPVVSDFGFDRFVGAVPVSGEEPF
ncbi:hypothetical protein SUGI_0666350 [Cryptomeria japonica]|nr:hypothetical protein SUGI_0666350 [Cryptomeria japonica]